MNALRLLLVVAAGLTPAFGAYTYDFANLLNPYNSSQWSGTGSGSASNNMYTSSSSTGGSLLSSQTVAAPSNSYEVRSTLTLTASGGNYITYLRASSGSLLATGNGGTFYAIEVANPVISGNTCTATLNIFKQTGANTLSNPYSSGIYCHNGMVVRAIVIPGNVVAVYIDNNFQTSWGWGDSTPITSGQPGVGVSGAPSGNGISAIDIGHIDTVAPTALNAQQVGTSSNPTHVDFQFPGAVDDPNGIGIAYYQFFRCTGTSCSQNWLDMTTTPQFTDTTVSPGTTYTYELMAQDYHYNASVIYITVTTPPAGSIDPREVGVRALGTYWGYGSEQIDMRSANLNYTVPLLKAMARGGWGVGFSLSYNSQNWRQDPGGTWQLGRDIGYGFGWRLQAGSLTPVYQDYWTVHHYLFIDATGAEYRLDQNSGGVWTSKEGIYVYYDSNAGRLYFRDGSFWVMGSLSAGTEQDAGTTYPTMMQDSNGNQVAINYNNGAGVSWSNSSSRINTIADVRKAGSATYSFSYNADSIPHLTGITNTIGTSEHYAFEYISTYSLTTPFGGGASYGTFTMLQCANSVTIVGPTTFAYDGNAPANCGNTSGGAGAGELSQMSTPYGAHIRWSYGSFTYIGSRTMRDVNARYLATASGGAEKLYTPWFQGDPNLTFHTYSGLDDADGVSEKAWAFGTTSTDPSYGLAITFEHRPHHYPNIAGESVDNSTWTTNGSGNPYISSAYHTDDGGNSTSVAKQTNQTVDQYGNLTQMQIYEYGALGGGPGSLARTYTNTYLNSSNYTSRYIFNRLLSSAVTDGTKTTTLVQNAYDSGYCTDATGINMHDSGYGTTFLYRGNVNSSTTPGGTKGASYDIGGNVTSATTNGVTTSVTTNSSTNWAAPSQITTGSFSSNAVYTAFMGLSSMSGPNGDTASIGYGASERPTSSTSPYGALTEYTYVDGVNASKTATTCPVAWNGLNCSVPTHWVRTTMDGFGRTTKTESGHDSTTVSVVDTNYISCGCTPIGKMYQVSLPYAPGGSPVYTTYAYDGLGRTTTVTAPDGSVTGYAYAGNTVTVTDPSGRWKTFTMDAQGNLIQVSEPSAPSGTPPAGTPVYSPAPGTYNSAQAVSITTTTAGASIRYTTDGSTPSETAGTVYSGSINLSSNTTLKAIAYGTGVTDSRIASGPYTISIPQVAAPTFSPVAGTYSSSQSVTISTTTSGASIRYTTDGSNPSETAGTLYSGAIAVNSTTTIKAIAYASGMTDSSISSATYTISPPVAAPTFSPGGGTYTATLFVTISTTTSGASIRYTTDGSNPSETAGTLYSGAVTVGSNLTLKAIAYKSGMTDSAIASASYTVPNIVVSISPTSVSLRASQSQWFSASATNSNLGVTFSISPSVGTMGSNGYYTAPSSIASNQTVTATATSVQDPTRYANATITLLAPTILRYNMGGSNYTDNLGHAWTGYPPPGDGSTANSTSSSISGALDQTIYKSQLVKTSGNLSYTFNVPNVTYTVKVHFAAFDYSQTIGSGIANPFDLQVNGTDMGNVGPTSPLAETDNSYSVSVTSGTLTITLISQDTSNPTIFINGIEIIGQQ